MRRNPALLVVHAALYFALFPIPVITLFWKDQIGMSLTDIMVLQAMFGVAVIVFEFPSGYLADRVGHRLSMIVGATLWLVGFLAYLPASSFAAVAAAEIALGAGRAFISGADRALLWASLDDGGRLGQYRRWDGRLRAAGQASEAVTAAAGGWLYSIGPRLPFWYQVPAAALGLASVLALRARPAPRTAGPSSHGRRILDIVRLTLWRHPRLQAAMALSVALGLSSYVMVWLIQPYLQSRGVQTVWLGPFWAGANAWLVAVSLASARIVERLGVRATLLGCCLLVPLGYAGLAASASPWGAAFYLCFMTVRGLQGPILITAMQEDAPDADRASVLSLAALLFRLAFAAIGPPIGALVDRAGMDAALAVLAGVFAATGLTALALFSRAHGRAPSAGDDRQG